VVQMSDGGDTDLAANIIGKSNARGAARIMSAILQNRRLNQHLLYSCVDEASPMVFRKPRENRR
jgi:sorting nexin-25